MEYFKRLIDLLKVEREEDKQQYLQLTKQTSVVERRAAGLSWYPIAIRGTEISHGDYLTVEVERTTHQDIQHQMRFGMPAVFFSNHDPHKDRIEGTIAYAGGNRLKITLKTDELPEWADLGKLGIDLAFDDNSYDEMLGAMKDIMALKEGPEKKLVQILIGEKKPSFRNDYVPLQAPKLNESQQRAVQKVLNANEIAIVHGPPGTGKTTTLVEAIKMLLEQEKKQLLVCAPSNTAVDLLSEKLSLMGIRVLRIGNPARISERLQAITLDSQMVQHELMKEAKKLKKQAQEYKNLAHKYKRNFGKEEREQRKLLFSEAHKIVKEVDKLEEHIVEDLVTKAQVITATLVGANHYTIRNLKFHTAVIDEAGQALEPACWIPISKVEKLVLAGDHLQLPPTIKSQEAAKRGLSETLLEKVAAMHPESVVLLDEQYRMHEDIMGYSSQAFYGNKLKAHATVAHKRLFLEDLPLLFIDTAGCGFEEKQEGTSTSNAEEASLLVRHLSQTLSQLPEESKSKSIPHIAIISPYKQQVSIIKELISHAPELAPFMSSIAVNTVDSFQGQERDIVYISMTRSNSKGEIGFLSDTRRMNVAMTRAKMKLVIVGDSATLALFPFYKEFIDYAEKKNAYKSAWEFI